MRSNESASWIITDPDCVQCCRHCPDLGPRVFELAQIDSFPSHIDENPLYRVAHGHLYLDDYSKDEALEMLVLYGYGDWNGFLEAYPDVNTETYDQLLAEMFFETNIEEFCSSDIYTWNQAVEQLQKITGLDVTEFKHPEKESLADLIHHAQEAHLHQTGVPGKGNEVTNPLGRFVDNREGR